MLQKLKSSGIFQAFVERNRQHHDKLNPRGHFNLEQWRLGKGGLYEKVSDIPFTNDTTNVGKNYMLGATFLGTSPSAVWYFGLIDGTGTTPTLAAADTMASHGGWTEFTDITQTVRQTWTAVANAGSNQLITNTAAQWTIAGSVDPAGAIAGAFIVSNNTIGGTAGTLWSTGKFTSPVPVQSGDIFKCNYVTGL